MSRRLKSWAAWVTDREIWPLAVGVVLATFTMRLAAWGLGLIVALWLIRWLGRGYLTIRTPLDWPVALLLLMIPVTFYATTDRLATFTGVSRLLAGLALVYGLANWTKRGAHVTLFALGLVGAGLGLALLAPISVSWFSKLPLIPARLYTMLPTLVSDTVHPNMMAGALVMLLPFPLALLLLEPSDTLPALADMLPGFVARVLDGRWFRRLYFGAAVLLMLGILALTQSRGGWIAGAAVLFLVLVRRQRRFLWLIPIAFLGFGLLLWRGDLPSLLDTIDSSGAVSNWEGRVELWSRALYMIQDFPFTGIGANTFKSVANALYPFFLAGPDADIGHAHSLLLQVAVDIGLPGLVAFLSILLIALWSALDSARFYRRSENTALSALAWAGMASLVGMLVHGTVDATTWIIGRGAFVPFAVIGMLMALQGRPEIVNAPVWRSSQAAERRSGKYWWIIVVLVASVAGGGYLGWRALQQQGGPLAQPSIRLPLYPDAQGAEVRTENPSADSGWVALLEVATFTTTHSIADVTAFYTGTLTDSGWMTEMEAGDATSWGGIYTQREGRSVCLLNAFHVEGETWVSIVCGDRTEPVELPPLSPLPAPTASP